MYLTDHLKFQKGIRYIIKNGTGLYYYIGQFHLNYWESAFL